MTAPGTPRAVPRVPERVEPATPAFVDEADIAGCAIGGDYSGIEAAFVEVSGCTMDGMNLTGATLSRSRIMDVVAVASHLSGLVFEDCRLTRVEFHRCRMSGFQAPGSGLSDVAFFDCKLDSANFRMTTLERVEFHRCHMPDVDLYGATAGNTRFSNCDLTGAQLAKADLAGGRLHGSILDRVQGGESLRGVTIGSGQITPAALAVFAALDISVDDEDA